MLIDTSCYGKIILGVLITLFLTFAFQPMYAAGSGSIKGRVLDKVTGEPLIGANIIVQNTSLGVATDIDGSYYLRFIPAGEWTLKVSYLGYKPASFQVTVTEDIVIEKEIRMEPQSLMGEEVVVTAQARGQQAAINQQLASNTISNIVAADRIKELPDASAAESIGRLPGISIDRYNGEATSVAIRGLAPKYNTVTVNGVALPATNNNDRSVDLSLISSNVLDGIEVKKANTPDMDADALGGTIDLRLKEAPEEFQTNATLQGGYSNLNKYYGNYSGVFGVSDRFFDNNLGVIFGLNADRNNRYADKIDAEYREGAQTGANPDINSFTYYKVTQRRDENYKNRLGANLLLDYKIPYGKLTGNGFLNQAKTEGSYRSDQLYSGDGHATRYYDLDDNVSTTSLYTTSVGAMQDFGWIKYDLGLSSSGSKTDDPNDYRWEFSQENGADSAGSKIIYASTPLADVYKWETPLAVTTGTASTTGLKSAFVYSTRLIENQKTAQFNFKIPFTVTDNINGYLKTGGKFKWLTRTFNQEQWGHDNLQYGNGWNGVNSDLVQALARMYPNDFNVARDSTAIASTQVWNLWNFDRGYTVPSNFLGGTYHGFGVSPDLRLMHELTSALQASGSSDWQRISIGSMGYDYDGIEQYQAGYLMAEIKLGPYLTLIPGVRYDADYTKYHGQSFRASNNAGAESPPSDFSKNENIRENSFWLPMVHLKIQPFDWLRIHLAGTETVTRPDYNMYAPITTLDYYSTSIVAANGSLKDSRSKNADAAFSIIDKYIGLLGVSGFYKSIDNLIMYQGITSVDTVIYKMINAQLNVNNPNWFINNPKINTWMNNPTPAQYRGVEFEWQTNFWYLPQPLTGLLFNINWTYINSTVDVPQYTGKISTDPDPTDPTHRRKIITNDYIITSRTQRMPDQPSHILNVTMGYEYKGFSIRASYIYQSDKVSSIGSIPLLDSFTGKYDRWDLAIQQKLGSSLQLYANLNNITNTRDESYLAGTRIANPTYAYYYGATMDVGLRYNF
jgi:TonB-dependent receptor